MIKEESVLPLSARSLDQRQETAALDLARGQGRPGKRGEGGENVDVRGEAIDLLSRLDFPGPANEKGHPRPALVVGALEAFHLRVVKGIPRR